MSEPDNLQISSWVCSTHINVLYTECSVVENSAMYYSSLVSSWFDIFCETPRILTVSNGPSSQMKGRKPKFINEVQIA